MDRVTPLLAQFPGPLMLQPCKRKWFVMLAASGLFTVGGVIEAVSSNSGNLSNWIGAAFFGLCTIGSVYIIFFASFEMTLDGDGFSWRGDAYTSSGNGPTCVILRWSSMLPISSVRLCARLSGSATCD
jgi:hypothetical protein